MKKKKKRNPPGYSLSAEEHKRQYESWFALARKKNLFVKMSQLKPGKSYTMYVAIDQGSLSQEDIRILRTYVNEDGTYAETDQGWSFYEYEGLAVTGSGANRSMLASNFHKMPKGKFWL